MVRRQLKPGAGLGTLTGPGQDREGQDPGAHRASGLPSASSPVPLRALPLPVEGGREAASGELTPQGPSEAGQGMTAAFGGVVPGPAGRREGFCA